MCSTKSSYAGGSPSKIIIAPTCMGWLWSSRWRKDASSGVSLSVAMPSPYPDDRRLVWTYGPHKGCEERRGVARPADPGAVRGAAGEGDGAALVGGVLRAARA